MAPPRSPLLFPPSQPRLSSLMVTAASPSSIIFLTLMSEAARSPWGLTLTINPPSRIPSIASRLAAARAALGDPPIAIRPSPLNPSELWLLPHSKCQGSPLAEPGSILFPSIANPRNSKPRGS